MKTYHNATTDEWYTEGSVITRRIENGVFSGIPTVAQLTEWGFVEYVPPVHERTLEEAKREKIEELEDYDSSTAVNEFFLNNEGMWFEPAKRDNYLNSLQSAKRLGQTTVPFLGQTLSIDDAITMIDSVNLYAMQCVGVTDTHRANIEALQSIADVDAYDFTVGYPQKVSF